MRFQISEWYYGEDDCSPPEPDKRWLAIEDTENDHREVCIVVQRKRDGVYRDDDETQKYDDAFEIISALNGRA